MSEFEKWLRYIENAPARSLWSDSRDDAADEMVNAAERALAGEPFPSELEGCRCGADKDEPHTCPFKSDINGDDTTLCTCCKECTHQCAMDI